MTDYRKMWTELGLDLEAHDQLMESQDKLFAKTHLSQKNRPRAMALFDQGFHASHAGRVAELWEHRKQGGKAIGTFCIYVPDEIALAVGVVPIPLCGGSDWPVSYADKVLPRDICPIIRSTFGMALSGTCPHGPLKDLIVGETTCDAKKKTWDLFGFKIMEVPQKKNDIDRELWRKEVGAFKDMMEELSGKNVSMENLAPAVRLVNRKRRALQRINEFRKLDSPPISGLDALLAIPGHPEHGHGRVRGGSGGADRRAGGTRRSGDLRLPGRLTGQTRHDRRDALSHGQRQGPTHRGDSRVADRGGRVVHRGIPSLKIVTDYSQEDTGQIRTRVEAFAELLDDQE